MRKCIPGTLRPSFLIYSFGHLKPQKVLSHLVLLFLLSIPKLYSQNAELPFKAAIALGPSFPVGKFTNTSLDTGFLQRQSAAMPGPSVTFSFSYKFKNSHFGVEIMGGWQQNDVDDSAIARSMSGNMPPGSEIIVKSDNWHIWKLLVGPIFEIPLTQKGKTSIECGLLGGILKTTIPGFESEEYYDNPPIAFFQGIYKIPLPAAFCYQLNVGINYQITRALIFTANLSFMHAAPVHSFTYYLDPPYYTMPVHTNQAYPISSLNLLIGVAYAF